MSMDYSEISDNAFEVKTAQSLIRIQLTENNAEVNYRLIHQPDTEFQKIVLPLEEAEEIVADLLYEVFSAMRELFRDGISMTAKEFPLAFLGGLLGLAIGETLKQE